MKRPDPLHPTPSWLRPLLSVLIGLALAGLIMQVSGYNVRDAYAALWTGATGLEAGPALRPGQVALGPVVSVLGLKGGAAPSRPQPAPGGPPDRPAR